MTKITFRISKNQSIKQLTKVREDLQDTTKIVNARIKELQKKQKK